MAANAQEIIAWDGSYALGIELIDNQHKELVRLINQLFQACLVGNEAVEAMFKEAMGRMVEYVNYHFKAEQELLTRVNYPNFAKHKKQHDIMIKNILEASKDHSGGKKFVPHNFVRTLRDWVLGHIAVSDKAYAAYILEQKSKKLLTDKQING